MAEAEALDATARRQLDLAEQRRIDGYELAIGVVGAGESSMGLELQGRGRSQPVMPAPTVPMSPVRARPARGYAGWPSAAVGVVVAMAVGWACHGGDDSGRGDNTGMACDVVDDCYPDVDDLDALMGDPVCLDRVPEGYCTHTCTTDADCCAVAGECDTDLPEVCAPFESTGMMMCFLSCEAEQVGDGDPDRYCHDFASTGFGCRSTGGGTDNRKVCAS